MTSHVVVVVVVVVSSTGIVISVAPNGTLRAVTHLEAGPNSLEPDCMKFQPFLVWRRASTTHYVIRL
jgi:hypothetical protein